MPLFVTKTGVERDTKIKAIAKDRDMTVAELVRRWIDGLKFKNGRKTK